MFNDYLMIEYISDSCDLDKDSTDNDPEFTALKKLIANLKKKFRLLTKSKLIKFKSPMKK